MSDWTPTTQQVRDGYRYDPEDDYHNPLQAYANAERNGRAFDRWLEQVKSEARAGALTGAGLLARSLPTRDEIATAIADGWNSVTTLNATAQSIGPSAAADAVLDLLKGQDR